MACQVTITSVTPYGSAGQPVTSIDVKGTATDCASVVVMISCGGLQQTHSVAVTPQGTWQATFTNLAGTGCECGAGFLRASAHCKDDVTCGDSRTLSPIPCEPYPCPTIDHIDVDLPTCAQVAQDNGWNVTFDAVIGGGGVTNYVWSFGDGQTVSGPTLQQVSHLYKCAGSYVVTLVITSDCQLGYADVDARTVELPPCGCPSVTDFSAYSVAGNACQWKFNVKLGPPFATCIQEYLWNFGDGSQQTTTVPEVEHTYAHDGSYTVMVTLLGGVGQVGGGPCFAANQISVSGCGDGNGGHHPCPWWNPFCKGWNLCAAILATALVAILAAGVLLMIGMCAQPVSTPLLIAAAAAAAVGLALLALWAAICRHLPGFCDTLKGVLDLLTYIIYVQSIVLAVMAALALLGIVSWPCALGALASWAYYGSVYFWLTVINSQAGCPAYNPPTFGQGQSASTERHANRQRRP